MLQCVVLARFCYCDIYYEISCCGRHFRFGTLGYVQQALVTGLNARGSNTILVS